MIKAPDFNPVLKKLHFGIIRLSDNFKIIDKNPAATRLFPSLRKNSDFSKLCCDKHNLEKLTNIGNNIANHSVFFVIYSFNSICTIALRDRDGSILLLFHPITARLDASHIPSLEKVISANAKALLELITSDKADTDEYISKKDLKVIDSFSEFNIKKVFPVKQIVAIIADSLSSLDLKKQFTLVIDSSTSDFGIFTDLSKALYVLTEMLATDFSLSPRSNASVKISVDSGFFNIIISDKRSKTLDLNEKIRLSIVSEFLSIFGVQIRFSQSSGSYFLLSASIPLEEMPYRLRKPEFFEIAFIAYALAFYGLTTDSDAPGNIQFTHN